jgi:hypothetical protein
MMALGDYVFGIDTAAFNELNRETEYRWPSQDVFGAPQVLQFTGWGSDTIQLPGVIYPEHFSDGGQLDALRELGSSGEPQTLIAGSGDVLGDWVIERVSERQSLFAVGGAARKQEFTLTLRRYGDGVTAVLDTVAEVVGDAPSIGGLPTLPSSGLLATISGAAANLCGTISSVAGQVSNAISAATGAVTAAADAIGSEVGTVLSALDRGNVLVSDMRGLGGTASQLLGVTPTLTSIAASMSSVTDVAPSMLARAVNVSATAQSVLIDLQAASAPVEAIAAVNDAVGSATRLATFISSSYHAAQGILEGVSS